MKVFAPDNSAILYLALIRKHHTNIFRFSITLTDIICPELLQTAVNRIYKRFPTVIAGFQASFFQYAQIPAKEPPAVKKDPGLLINMTRKEIARCAYRVYYDENMIIVEGFHALSDGYGMVASISTLTAEYLNLRYGLEIPNGYPVFELSEAPKQEEMEDAYLKYAKGTPLHMPSRYSYQLPGSNPSCSSVLKKSFVYPVEKLHSCARKYGVSITALVCSVMAASVMELQEKCEKKRLRPVRIMVPVDLRKIFPSKTLRNFILYALPTMEASEQNRSIRALAQSFSRQIKNHLDKKNLSGILAYNVKIQNMPFYKILPLFMKCAIMRTVYTFFGESNSSLTMTNLGNLTLHARMLPYVKSIDLTMMPRLHSPYNCGMYSYKGDFFINLCRFPQKSDLEEIFSKRMTEALYGEESSL